MSTWAFNASAESGLGYSHLLDLIDPPPPPKPEGEEEEEEEEGAPQQQLPSFLQDQRDAREARVALEKQLNDLQIELEKKDSKVDGLLETGKKYYDADGNPLKWKGNMRPRPEIETDIKEVSAKLVTAKYDEEDASVICIGKRAASLTHDYEAHPITCSFEGIVVSGDGDGGGGDTMWGSATIKVDDDAPSKPSDILLMVDVSASMGAAAGNGNGNGSGNENESVLDVVKRSLFDMVSDMEAGDRCALLGYGDSAKVYINTEAESEEPTPWVVMTSEGKAQMKGHISKLTAYGLPNMKPALDLAFTTLASSRPKAISTAIMLSGSRPQDADATFFLGKKLPAIAREGSSIDFTTTLSALGIGAGHDAALLSKIATAGHGSYVNIASPVLVSEQLGRLLSASRRTVVAGMHLVFEGCAPCELLEVEPGYGVSAHECSSTRQSSYFRTQKVMCLEVGALSAGQTRTVLFKLGLPGGDMVNKMAVNTPLARFLSCYSAGADKKGNGLLHLHHHTFRVMDVPRLTCKKPLQDGVPVRVNVTGDAATLEVSVVRQNIASCLASLMQNDGLGPALSAQEVEQMKGYFSVDGVTQNTDAMDRVMHRMQREEQLEDMKLKATSEWEVKVKGERKERAAAKRKKEKEAAAAAEAAATAAAAEGAAAAAPADGAGAGEGEGDAAAADADAATADGGDAAATAAAPAAVEEEEEEEVVVDEGAPEVTIPPPGIVSIDLRYTSPDPNKCHRMLVAIQKAFSTGVLQEQVNAALKEQAEREAEVARKALEALYNSPDEKAKREVEAAALAEEEAKAKAEAEALALAEEAAAVELARAIAAGEVEAPAPVEPVPVPEEEGGEAVKVPPVPPPPTIVNEGYRELVHYTIPGAQCVNRLAQVAMCEALATGDDTRFQSTLTLPDFARCDPNRDAASATLAQRQIGMYMCSSSAGEAGKYAAIMSEQQQQQAQCASEWPSVSYTSCHTLPLPPSRYLTSESRRTGELLGNYQWAREQVPCRMLPVTATAASDACVQLAWGVPVPDSNVQGTAVTHYTLRAVKAGGEIHGKAVLERVYEAPRSRCCIDQLTGGTYYFTVCAGNGKWDGAMSDVSTCVVIGTKEENNKNNNQEEEKKEKVTEFIKVSTVDREWKWYPAMSMWEQLPAVNENNPEEEGMWPPQVTVAETIQQQVPLAVEIAASPSGNGSIEVMWNAKYRSGSGSGEDDDGTGTGTGRYGEGEVTGGCAPHKTYHVAVVCAATGKQITKVYDSSVSDCCVQGLGGSDGSNGNYHVAVWASNGFSMGLLSKPILVRLKGRKVPSSADNTFEFKIGGVLFRRPADI